MFRARPDDRLSIWAEFRQRLEQSVHPYQEVVDFWAQAPIIPHNSDVDPFYQKAWPTPWEIIFDNRYDDFTLALMMGYTLLLTDRFKDSLIEIKTLVDLDRTRLYNVVCVDNSIALNFKDGHVVPMSNIPSLYRLENLVTLERPR